MIKKMNDIPPRSSGVIYGICLEQIRQIFTDNPALAGEFAISVLELVLTGEISSDDKIVNLGLANMKVIVSKDMDKYERTKEYRIRDQIEKLKLEEIAGLYWRDKKTQSEIAKELDITQQAVSKRIATIKVDYPQIFSKYNGSQPIQPIQP